MGCLTAGHLNIHLQYIRKPLGMMQVSRLGLACTSYLELYRPLEDPECAGNAGSETARKNIFRAH